MNETGIIIAVIVLVGAATTDVVVRLKLASGRRDQFVGDLLDSMLGTGAPAGNVAAHQLHREQGESLRDSLLRHFEQSNTSRQILAALMRQAGGLSEAELFSAVNHQLADQRKRGLPAAVVRRVVLILMGANLTVVRQGRLQITENGRHLHALLNPRPAGGPPPSAFASP